MIIRTVILVLLALSFSTFSTAAGKLEIGKPPPPFTLKSLDGSDISLHSFKGKVVLLNFWATWCVPCRIEMPELEKAYRQNKNKGFTIIAVNVLESIEKASKFVKEKKLSFHIALDSKGKIMKKYKVRFLPYSFLIDREGVLVKTKVGLLDKKTLDDWLTLL